MTLAVVPDVVEPVASQLDEAEAQAITARIRSWVRAYPTTDVALAYRGRVWVAMGYESWSEWCGCELDGFKLPSADDRQAVVAELSAAGLSQRSVAGAVGVGVGTVNRDLAKAPVPHETGAEDRTVVGQDGKTYPAQEARMAQKRKPMDGAIRKAAQQALTLTGSLERIAADARVDHYRPLISSLLLPTLHKLGDLTARLGNNEKPDEETEFELFGVLATLLQEDRIAGYSQEAKLLLFDLLWFGHENVGTAIQAERAVTLSTETSDDGSLQQ